jgi:hypothetical protein
MLLSFSESILVEKPEPDHPGEPGRQIERMLTLSINDIISILSE